MHFFDAGHLLVKIHGLSHMGRGIDPTSHALVIPLQNYNDALGNVEYVCRELERLELNASLASATLLRSILQNEIKRKRADELPHDLPGINLSPDWIAFDPLPLGRYQRCVADLINRFKDEMGGKTVAVVSHANSKFMNPKEPLFGSEVFNAFPSANDDIAEAGCCLAFDRGTACVMHLMRSAEVALRALAKALGVGPQNDWGSYIRGIEKELANRAKNSGARSADEHFYAEAATSFDHLKRAWRNPTMHVDKSYSPDRAAEIFGAVRSFMRHLATRISE